MTTQLAEIRHHPRLARWPVWLIVAGLLGLSALAGLASAGLVSKRVFLAAAGGPGALLAGYLFLRRPLIGLLLLFVLSNTLPWELSTGTNTDINVTFVLAALLTGSWLLGMVLSKNVRLRPSPLNMPLLLFALAFAVSLLAGRMLWNYWITGLVSLRVQLVQVALVWLSIGLLLVAGNRLGRRQLRWLVTLFLVISTLAIANAYLAGMAGVLPQYYFIHTVGMFPSWAVALALGLALEGGRRSIYLRLGLVASVMAWLAWALLVQATLASAWLPPLIAVVVILYFHSKKLLTATLIGLIVVALPFAAQLRAGIIDEATGGGARFRPRLWGIVAYTAARSPLVGLGPANYRPYATFEFDFRRPGEGQLLPAYMREAPSHNQYIDILAQTGFFGLGAYLWLLGAVFLVARRRYQAAALGFDKGYSLAVVGACAATLVIGLIGDWALPYVYNIGVFGFRQSAFTWIFFGGLIALDYSDNDPAGQGS
jgi:O-antigen ligase